MSRSMSMPPPIPPPPEFEFLPMGIWINDKKPQAMSDIIGNIPICKLLNQYISTGQIPNLLFVGDNGVGKRTLANIFCKSYLNDDLRGRLLIDGAISRGKDIICETVQDFAHRRITMDKKKIIIITNFDSMTHEAQNALRRIMEIENSVRFILTCNDMSDIIEALQSRCIILKIKPLDYSESLELIKKLSNKIPHDIAEIISLISEGDMKRIINYTQTTAISNGDINSFHKIFNIPPMKYIEKLLVSVSKGESVFEGIDYLMDQGHNYNDIIDILSRILTYRTELLPDDVRYKYLYIVSEHFCEISPNTVRLHLYALFGKLHCSLN